MSGARILVGIAEIRIVDNKAGDAPDNKGKQTAPVEADDQQNHTDTQPVPASGDSQVGENSAAGGIPGEV